MPEDTKDAFRRHLTSLGYELDEPRHVILEKLRGQMGDERYHQANAMAERPPTASTQEGAYKLYRDLPEANLFRSLDAAAVVEANSALYEHAFADFFSGVRVLELGCWTGALASFIAKRHPACHVDGVDAEQPIVDAANAYYGLPNLRFHRWNYFRGGKPETLELADVLLCAMGVVHHLPYNQALFDPMAVRRSGEYKIQNQQAQGYFSLWRSAAAEEARLFAVLRLHHFPRFIAWLDAACEVGWRPQLERTWHLDYSAAGKTVVLPGFVLQAVPLAKSPSEAKGLRLPEEVLVDHWEWFDRRSTTYAELEGGAAVAAYRGLGPHRTVLGRWEGAVDSVLTRDEVGTIGPSAYAFRHNAIGHFRMAWLSITAARQFATALADKKPLPLFRAPAPASPSSVPAAPPPAPARPVSPFAQGRSPFAG